MSWNPQPITPGAGILVSDIFALVRLWLSDPAIGSTQNPSDQEERWDDSSLVDYLNGGIDDTNRRMPELGLTDPATYSPQPHVGGLTDRLAYPANLTAPLAHRVCADCLTEDDTDKANPEEAQRHLALYAAFFGASK
jgi:hypothetical protein